MGKGNILGRRKIVSRYLILLLVIFAGCGRNLKERWEDYHDLCDEYRRLELNYDYDDNRKTIDAIVARMERLQERSLNILAEIVSANPEELMRIRDEGESGIGEVIEGKITVEHWLKDEIEYLKAIERFK